MDYFGSNAVALDGFAGARPAPALRAERRSTAVVNEAKGHRSLAFKLIAERLGGAHKTSILDLGPAVSGNVEFLSRFNCKVYIEDLGTALETRDFPSGDESPRGVAQFLQPYSQDAKFDIILAWDLFNYLELPAVAELTNHLRGFCNPGALIFALLYTAKQMPERPSGIQIVDENHLEYDARGVRRCPQYGAPVLLKRLRRMHVMRTYLLKSGVQEYVFRFC